MKTVVFSDTHITKYYEPKKADFLKRILESADKVVIAGDFVDLYESSLEEILNTKWKDFFDFLKSKNTVFLYGNHDKEKDFDMSPSAFSRFQANSIEIATKNIKLFIEHGHQILPTPEITHPNLFDNKLIVRIGNTVEGMGLNRFMRIYSKILKKKNNELKKWANQNLPKNEILVAGHIHLPEFNIKKKYINLGQIRFGFASYVLIKDNKIKFIQTKYK